jgi:hypothetical protein
MKPLAARACARPLTAPSTMALLEQPNHARCAIQVPDPPFSAERARSRSSPQGSLLRQTGCWSKPDSNSRSHPLTRRQTHGSDRMNGAERDTVVGSGSLVTLDPGAAKREIARSFPVRPWALSQARGA